MELTVNGLKDILFLAFGDKIVLNEGGTYLNELSEATDFLDYYIEVTPVSRMLEPWSIMVTRRWSRAELSKLELKGRKEGLIKQDMDEVLKSVVSILIANTRPVGIPMSVLANGSVVELMKNEDNFHYDSVVEQKVIRQYNLGLIEVK